MAGHHAKPKAPIKLVYESHPRTGLGDWMVEERFRDWGKPLIKSGDDFTDWVAQTRKDTQEATLEEELRQLFLEDLHGKEPKS